MALLEVEDLRVHFRTEDGIVRAVDGVSYTVDKGEAFGIVGESGSGKSVSSLAVMGLARFSNNAHITGRVTFNGIDLLTATDDEMRQLRGSEMAMIFQDPLSSLHPFYRIGDQLVEAINAHRSVPKAVAVSRAAEMLELVGIPEPRKRLEGYPHEFSGGMRQRVMIAMALINDPKLIIADEPTTALDVTVQAQILDLLTSLQKEFDAAVIMITHDLGVVAQITDRIAVMYAGRVVEHAGTEELFARPEHPYTWGLLGSIPRLDQPADQELVPIPGRPPSLINRPSGCSFHPRCFYAQGACAAMDPGLNAARPGARHEVACLLPTSVRAQVRARLDAGDVPDDIVPGVDLTVDPALAQRHEPHAEEVG